MSKAGYASELTIVRTWRAAFANDYAAITAATSQIREGFRESAAVTDLSQIASMCDEALDAAEFMKANVAQARLTDRGTYRTSQLIVCLGTDLLHTCAQLMTV